MSEIPDKSSEMSNADVQKKFSVPVEITDKSIFDGAFTFMKERFASEMRRMEDEMDKFSTDLMHVQFNGQTTTVQTGSTSPKGALAPTSWEVITSSPLVEGEGDDKMLRLQFDVSQFAPHEVTVKILNGTLIVSATHVEKTDSSTVYSEYHREFILPAGTDPETVESSLSKDGVLTVRTPLNLAVTCSTNPAIKLN